MNRIKELRKEKKLSLKKLGELVNIPTTSLSNYERGYRESKIDIWIKIADALDVEPAYLIGLIDENKSNDEEPLKVAFDFKTEWFEFENDLAAKLNELSETHNILEVHYAAVSSSDWMVMSGGNTMALVKAKRFK